jgi:RHS repeat-associated protein
MSRIYTPDNVGNIEAITDNLDSSRSQSFGYDDLYRLTSAAGVYGSIGYTYDRVGNRKSETQGTQSDSYAYYPGTNRLQTITGAHPELFQYDDDGNTIQRIPGAANPSPPMAAPAEFLYNSSGQRTQKEAGTAVIYHYDPAGQLIAETDASGTLRRAYIWLHGQPLAMLDAAGTVYYFHNDHLGTPQKMTDAGRTVVWAADYLPFGQANVTVATVENNLRFAGQYYDSETGLHYNYWRYYDPKIGRYLRGDPGHSLNPEEVKIPFLIPFFLKSPQGLNTFTYVGNNPAKWIDSKGLLYGSIPHFPELDPGGNAFGGGVAAAAGAAAAVAATGGFGAGNRTEMTQPPEYPPEYHCPPPDPCVAACLKCVKGKWYEKPYFCAICVGCILFGGM